MWGRNKRKHERTSHYLFIFGLFRRREIVGLRRCGTNKSNAKTLLFTIPLEVGKDGLNDVKKSLVDVVDWMGVCKWRGYCCSYIAFSFFMLLPFGALAYNFLYSSAPFLIGFVNLIFACL